MNSLNSLTQFFCHILLYYLELQCISNAAQVMGAVSVCVSVYCM